MQLYNTCIIAAYLRILALPTKTIQLFSGRQFKNVIHKKSTSILYSIQFKRYLIPVSLSLEIKISLEDESLIRLITSFFIFKGKILGYSSVQLLSALKNNQVCLILIVL